jgi:phosphoglycolate phosphatase
LRVAPSGPHHAHRPELPAIARQRAEALLGRQIPGSDVVVIGDTPADMGCGRGIGARAIGVATGRYTADDLRACGAAAVFENLSDTDAVVRAVMGA